MRKLNRAMIEKVYRSGGALVCCIIRWMRQHDYNDIMIIMIITIIIIIYCTHFMNVLAF